MSKQYKFAVLGKLVINRKEYIAGPKGLIVDSKEEAEAIKKAIGSKYSIVEGKGEAKAKDSDEPKLTPQQKSAATRKRKAAEKKALADAAEKAAEELEGAESEAEAELPSED